ncbi:MAG: cupin domain-containing protein [Oxalobacter sp.]|nr:MAG: cupin domain-containing protein [Oxalobacter sp.]
MIVARTKNKATYSIRPLKDKQIIVSARTILFALTVGFCSLSTTSLAVESSEAVTVTPLLKTRTVWDGKPLAWPQGKAEVTALRVEVAPGAETGWHRHSVPSFAVMLEGSLEVRLLDGRTKRLKAGDVLAEVVDTAHNGRNIGSTPVKLVVFYAGLANHRHTTKSTLKPIGGERDAHGCIGSAGYRWCARENACVRPWELAKQKDFPLSAENIEAYCASAVNN